MLPKREQNVRNVSSVVLNKKIYETFLIFNKKIHTEDLNHQEKFFDFVQMTLD
jgi:hypothetical protein